MPPHRINLNSSSNFGMQGNKMVYFITTDLDFWGSTFVLIFRDQLLLKSVGINTKNFSESLVTIASIFPLSMALLG